jgi:hypothetical protein
MARQIHSFAEAQKALPAYSPGGEAHLELNANAHSDHDADGDAKAAAGRGWFAARRRSTATTTTTGHHVQLLQRQLDGFVFEVLHSHDSFSDVTSHRSGGPHCSVANVTISRNSRLFACHAIKEINILEIKDFSARRKFP